MTWVLIAGGAVLTALGLGAYTGVWRSWSGRVRADVVFPLLFVGLAILAGGIFGALIDTPAAVVGFIVFALGGIAGACFLVLIFFGVPRWLQPRWYRAVSPSRAS
ncbi:hypothetical protein GCM10025867_12170 [Frondihabitans sucicola]|uniref:GlsB/YeaQ/YmgE family stress response membrane protein n=1 Tax=Frondihabitans sucicola TaxID=1268041 RepID=A0ABN6XZ77_9MICO|nr:hypothetical protein [Frondihabitans sucicola]BDZ48976.1 hypothetical protein GCM10025867_12170 [Frondihabitans sucicola]